MSDDYPALSAAEIEERDYGHLVPLSLPNFLLARVAEDEKEAASYLADLNENPPSVYDMVQVGWIEAGTPERVLAECEFKRWLVGLHVPVDYTSMGMRSPNACHECGMDVGMHDWEWDENSFPCETLRRLAVVYADHDDYREEWKP